MRPLVRGAVIVAVMAALSGLGRQAPPPPPPSQAPPVGTIGLRTFCPPGYLPEGPVCLRIPGEAPPAATPDASTLPWPGPPAIPRRPERPAEASAYAFPIRPFAVDSAVHGDFEHEIRLTGAPGDAIVALAIEHQEGGAEVTFVGEGVPGKGATVALVHYVREWKAAPARSDAGRAAEADAGGRLRAMLILYRGIAHLDPGIHVGARLNEGAALGSLEAPELCLSARLVHEGIRPVFPDEKKLLDEATSLPIDLRNVLPRMAERTHER